MKKIVMTFMSLMLLWSVSPVGAEEAAGVSPDDTTRATADVSDKAEQPVIFVLSYLHMNRRCMTCEKLETYSAEAVLTEFATQLKDSSFVWRTRNFEDEGNEHYAEKYNLYSQSLIISKLQDGQEVEAKSLGKIWELVGDKEDFIAYVQTEVREFMNPVEDK
jgi:hypothetical protein